MMSNRVATGSVVRSARIDAAITPARSKVSVVIVPARAAPTADARYATSSCNPLIGRGAGDWSTIGVRSGPRASTGNRTFPAPRITCPTIVGPVLTGNTAAAPATAPLVALTTVTPGVCPMVNPTDALPEASVLTDEAASDPSPDVTEKATGTL